MLQSSCTDMITDSLGVMEQVSHEVFYLFSKVLERRELEVHGLELSRALSRALVCALWYSRAEKSFLSPSDGCTGQPRPQLIDTYICVSVLLKTVFPTRVRYTPSHREHGRTSVKSHCQSIRVCTQKECCLGARAFSVASSTRSTPCPCSSVSCGRSWSWAASP